MLGRLSVNAILKTVIAVLATAVVVVMALDAWDSWLRVRATNRIALAADASVHMFTAITNLRLDRNFTPRDLQADQVFTSINPQITETRRLEMPALKSVMGAFESIDIPDRQAAVAGLGEMSGKLERLQPETLAALGQPKAARRAGIAKDYADATSALIDKLDQLSVRLMTQVRLADGYVDQLMEIKQLATMARYAAGDLSVMISGPLSGQPVPPDALAKYTTTVGALENSWAVLTSKVSGLPLPSGFAAVLDRANREALSADFTALRARMMNAVVARQPTELPLASWSAMSVQRLAMIEAVAAAALAVAKDHAAEQNARSMRTLWVQLGALAVAAAFAGAMILMVSRRVISPLLTIKDAMLKLAGGDMTAGVSFGARRDEIGALAGAMIRFKESMIESDRLRAEQKEAEVRMAAERRAAEERETRERKAAEERQDLAAKNAMHEVIKEFQAAMGNVVETVASAATELEASAGTLTGSAEATQQRADTVAAASEEASANVQSVASSAEQLTASVSEISKQVQASSDIARHAVAQAEKTDVRVTELSQAASRIGDVVKLITAIAEQTNLLALNATIEAARAGEAGRGFAVVAQEVKALASQTAKATGDIGAQISSMQAATRDSVAAIKEIGSTIGKIAEISGAIATAVEEQGAATQEIARNVEQAAKGTGQVSANIAEVSHHASETGAASTQMLCSAQSLSQQGNRLKAEMERFLHTIRTGIGNRRRFDDPNYPGPERRKDHVATKTAA